MADRAGKFDAERAAVALSDALGLSKAARQFGDARIAQALREAFEAGVEASAKVAEQWTRYYPADVFPPDSITPDAIAGTAMRTVLPRVAEDVRALLEKERGK